MPQKYMGILFILLVTGVSVVFCDQDGKNQNVTNNRDSKFMSLFAIVNFKNIGCSSAESAGYQGTCFSSTECSDKGGTDGGNCAAGFGTCCLFTITGVSGTVTENCTYVQNVGYPSAVSSTASSSTYTLTPSNPTEVCSIRLDFAEFVMTPVTTNGAILATTENLQVTGPTGKSPPLVSGTLTGQHMYVDTNRMTTSTTINVDTLATTTTAKWRIKVSFLECECPGRPPLGCTQYFTSNSGTIKSYNYDGSQELANQENTICIRTNEGKCKVTYTAATTIAPSSFIVGSTIAGAETDACTVSAVYIPRANPTKAFSGFVCNMIFSDTDAATVNGAITQSSPFQVTHRSGTTAAATRGFSLNYVQQGC